jgi:putative ABC transport system substrate-binding protein
MKKALLICMAVLLVAGAAWASGTKEVKVGVTVIVTHPALQADQKGFEKALADAGIKAKYDYQNAQGEMANAQTIAQKFATDKSITLVHAIATPTAQAACKTIKNKPVVYSSVTDPVGAGLVKTMGPAGGNVTGISDAWPIARQVKLYHEMLPKAKKWGTIYNAGDQNSVKSIGWTKEAMKKLGLTLVEVTVANSSEVYTAAQSLVGRVDAIYITSDNTVVSGFEALTKVVNQKKIPMFAGDTGSVPRGAIAALGFDYFQVGYSAGKKAAQIIKGKKAGDIPSGYTEKLSLHISLKNAKAQGVKIPKKYLKMAKDTGGKVLK